MYDNERHTPCLHYFSPRKKVLIILYSKHVEHVEPRVDPENGVYKMGCMIESP
jgi:hypothetical protein